MCNVNCCCSNLSKQGLITCILIFISINFVISFIAIFIRAGNTDRYKQALIFLEQINNDEYDNYSFDDCKTDSTYGDDTYCNINGKYLYKPSDSVSYQDLFKKWKSVELALNIVRTIITLSFFLYLYFIILKKIRNFIDLENANNQIEIENIRSQLDNSRSILIIILSSLIAMNAIFFILRILALTANNDIGLYEEGKQNSFEQNTAINYIFDIAEIIIYSIAICFGSRLKRNVNQIIMPIPNPPPPVVTPPIRPVPNPVPKPIPQTNININVNVNQQNLPTEVTRIQENPVGSIQGPNLDTFH